jgi:hypothetical protein
MESLLSDCLFWSNWNSWRKLKVGSHSTAVLHNSIFTGDTTEATNTSAMVFECTIFSIAIVFTFKNHCIIGCIKVLKRLKILFCKYRNRCGQLCDWCGFKKERKTWRSLFTCGRSDEQEINLVWPYNKNTISLILVGIFYIFFFRYAVSKSSRASYC